MTLMVTDGCQLIVSQCCVEGKEALEGTRLTNIAEVESFLEKLGDPTNSVGDLGVVDMVVAESPFFKTVPEGELSPEASGQIDKALRRIRAS